MTKAVIYTDGSATILPDGSFLCGYSYVFVVDGVPVLGKAFPGKGTINQAEMCAVYSGMRDAVANGIEVTEVYTDSTYVVSGLRSNREKYKSNTWVNAHGTDVLNKDMWINIIGFEVANNIQIPAVHVKGHAGHPFNELCDKLAKEAALNQTTIIQYDNPDKCVELFGEAIPRSPEPMPIPPDLGDVITPTGDNLYLSSVLAGYTDDRSKCCIIRYPEMTAFVSKGIAKWETSTDDTLSTRNVIHPVLSSSGYELPLYKYMTELGSPADVVIRGSNIQWQGKAFNKSLIRAINNMGDGDLFIASSNLASMKKYQGIYIGCVAGKGDDHVYSLYRSERADNSKCMVIPKAYCKIISEVLQYDDAVIGLTVDTPRYCLLATSSKGGVIVSSAVIPTTFNTVEGLSVIVDKNDRVSVRISDPAALINVVTGEQAHLEHSISLSGIIDSVEYPNESSGDVNGNQTDLIIITCEAMGDMCHADTDINDDHANIDHICDSIIIDSLTKEEAIKLYNILHKMCSDLFNYIISDKFKCSEMTPQKITEIEDRVRAEMRNKLNSLFI